MKNLIQDIDIILNNFDEQINNKILGINYLEKLKYFLIEQVSKKNYDFFNNLHNKEFCKQFSNVNFKINVVNYPESVSKVKYTLSNDYLCIIFNGLKTFEINQKFDSNKTIPLNLKKNMGIVLPKGTLVNYFISKKTILFEAISLNESINQF